MERIESVPDICEVSIFSGPEADPTAVPDVFCELPHGATELAHLDRAREMISNFPERYVKFFLANTDQGSPEYATRFVQMLTDPDDAGDVLSVLEPGRRERAADLVRKMKIMVLRSLLPRTIVDVNRAWTIPGETLKSANLTGTVGKFITDENDLERLRGIYDRYQENAARGYERVCSAGGFAFNLHTYAPISVSIIEGEDVVDTLERAYLTDHYHTYPVRPVVQLITAPPDEARLADPVLVDLIQKHYDKIGVNAQENDPFPLHPATTAYTHSVWYPGRVLTMEISRSALVDRFEPFKQMEIDMARAEKMARPIAAAFLDFLVTRA